MKRMIHALAVAALMPFAALTATWHVNCAPGSDSYSGLSASASKATIQVAIDASSTGDTVLVPPSYLESLADYSFKYRFMTKNS